MPFLKPHSEKIYAAMRFIVGIAFMCHGLQKIVGLFGGSKAPPWVMYGGGSIEMLGGALVALGLFTVPVAFICSGQMAVAYFYSHFPRGFFPIQNGGELAVIYCWVFLFIASKGAGVWSLDSLRSKG